MKNHILITFMAIFLVTACSPPTPQQELQTTIKAMQKLIEQKQSKELLAEYVYLPSIHNPIEDIPANKLERLKTVLAETLTRSPTFNEAQTEAKFQVKSYNKAVIFVKINGKWLMKN